MAISGTDEAIVINAVVVVTGVLVLIISNFVPIIHFGWMVCVTMLICSVSTLTIIPTILFLCSREEERRYIILFTEVRSGIQV